MICVRNHTLIFVSLENTFSKLQFVIHKNKITSFVLNLLVNHSVSLNMANSV